MSFGIMRTLKRVPVASNRRRPTITMNGRSLLGVTSKVASPRLMNTSREAGE